MINIQSEVAMNQRGSATGQSTLDTSVSVTEEGNGFMRYLRALRPNLRGQ